MKMKKKKKYSLRNTVMSTPTPLQNTLIDQSRSSAHIVNSPSVLNSISREGDLQKSTSISPI